MPMLLATALLSLTNWGCTAVNEEGFFPTDQGRLYITDLPVSAVSAASGATETVEVISNVVWTATVDQTWVTVAKSGDDSGTPAQRIEGKGRQELTLTFQANTTANERKVTLTITPDDDAADVKTVTTVITQNSPNFAVTPLDITGVEPNEPKNQTIIIVANNEWSIESRSNWIHATPNSGIASEGEEINVELSFDNNYTNAERTGEVVIRCGDQAATVSVRQLKGAFTVSKDTFAFGADGGSETIDISCISDWTSGIQDCDWLSVSPSMGNGNTSGVTITAAPNTSSEPRSGTITFTSLETTIPVTITQTSGVLKLWEQLLTIGPASQEIVIPLECPGEWRVSAVAGNEWSELLTPNGIGNGQIRIAVEENSNTEVDRVAEFNVTFGSQSGIIRITQYRAEPPLISYTDVVGIEKYTVGISATVESKVRILESGFYYAEGDDLDPANALFRRTIPCRIDDEGKMETTIEGLESAITYVIRAYVKTETGTFYGDVSRFTTAGLIPDEEHPLPTTK